MYRFLYKWTMHHHNGPQHGTKLKNIDGFPHNNQVSSINFNSTTHFRMFIDLVKCFLRVTVSLPCRLQPISNTHIPIYPYLIIVGRRNCSTL